MDSYERILKVLDFEEPDRVPTFDMINNTKVYERFAIVKRPTSSELKRMSSYLSPDASIEEAFWYYVPLEEAVKAYRAMGIDMTRFYPRKKNWMIEWLDGWCRYLGVDKEGWIFQSGGCTTWIAKRPFRILEEAKDYVPGKPDEDLIAEDFVKGVKEIKEAFYPIVWMGCTTLCYCDTLAYLGADLFYRGLYEAPDLITRIFDSFTHYNYTFAKLWGEEKLGPVFLIGDDIADKKTLMSSPRFLRENWIPRLKRMINVLKKNGVRAIFHSDGNLNPIVDELVNAGIEGLNPIDPLGDMDIAKIKEKYGDKLILIGNVDCSNLLPFGSVEEVIERTKYTIDVAAPGSGLILGSSSEIHEAIPVENAIALYETARRYGRYPLEPKLHYRI